MAYYDLIWEDRRVPLIEEPNDPSSEFRLEAIMASQPVTVAVRGIFSFADLQQVSSRLAVWEALYDVPDGQTKLWAVMGETPASIRSLTHIWPHLPRLSGLIFSCDRMLATFKLNVDTPFEDWPDPLRMGRNLTVLRALELNIPAYEWVASGVDPAKAKDRALRDGFNGIVTLEEGI